MRHPSIHFETDSVGCSVATVIGEIDAATAPLLRRDLLATSSPDVVDLRFVSLLSAAAVNVLLEAHRRHPFRTVGSIIVDRVLRILELDEIVGLHHPDGPPALLTAPFGVAVHDVQLRYLYVNEALAAINGLPAPSHLGHRPDELFCVERDDITPIIRTVGSTHQPREIRVSGATAAGQAASWRCSYHAARYIQDDDLREVVIATVEREAVGRATSNRLLFDAQV